MAALDKMASNKLYLQNPKLLFSTTGMQNQHILEPVKGSHTDQETLHPKSNLWSFSQILQSWFGPRYFYPFLYSEVTTKLKAAL